MTLAYGCEDGIACLLIDNPPVNALGAAVRAGLLDGVRRALADDAVEAIVIACNGRSFVTGADMDEFERGFDEPSYAACFDAIENSPKPVIAALHGSAMGGGVELALACHYRTAQPGATCAMPEITLGVVPGAGGTQRLPRLVGPEVALDMLLSGAPLKAQAALEAGLVDEIREGVPAECGILFARDLLSRGEGARRTRDARAAPLSERMVDAALQRHARLLRGRTTHAMTIEAMGASAGDFDEGIGIEKRFSDASIASRESQALRHMFFAERRSSAIPGMPNGIEPAPISRVAVVGAGTMGSGIAMAFANNGFRVTLVDSREEGLERGRSIIRTAYEGDARRGRLRAASVEDAVGAITFALGLEGLEQAELVVEAVFENMELKKQVLGDIAAHAGPDCIIATNTSSLSVTELGAATGRPDKVVGLHFFSPAHVMKLLEIVRGDLTGVETLATAISVAGRIRKIPVVSGDGFAFIGNRMMLDGAYREGEQMLLEGAEVPQLDRAIEKFGFAMGQNRVNDMAGVDIGTLVREQLRLREDRADPYCVISDALTAMGRIGQKAGKGFYDYSENPRQGAVDPEVTALIERLASERGIERRVLTDAEIVERFVLQLVNVGADILAEGIAYRASDIDVVWCHGFGFPRYKGGPMFHADTLGLAHVLERVEHYHARFGDYWKPSPLLVELARAGSSFADYDRERKDR